MNIEEIIALIKTRVTPSSMREILSKRNIRTFNITSTYISIEGRPSGNFRIQTRIKEEVQLFILSMEHFEQHPLKINQWR